MDLKGKSAKCLEELIKGVDSLSEGVGVLTPSFWGPKTRSFGVRSPFLPGVPSTLVKEVGKVA